MRRHSSAHFLQDAAHCLQWSSSWREHSSAHASQISAQTPHNAAENSPPIIISSAAERHTEAHCRSNSMHRAIIFTSSSFRHCVAQFSHVEAHVMHASMQLFICFSIVSLFNLLNGLFSGKKRCLQTLYELLTSQQMCASLFRDVGQYRTF